MLTFKQRYKPRTTREYTKSDLTVYDSAGNTALNVLTIYGKSEVVDGSIKSAGEGYAVVRLADLTWSEAANRPFFYATISNLKNDVVAKKICNLFKCDNETVFSWSIPADLKTIYSAISDARIFIKNTDYTSISDFIASLGDATLCYELTDPTQGNTIAIKTDNGTGVDGTMAVFETGTPLYGISDTVRDVMTWDGTSGEVTKVYNKIRLANLTWKYLTSATAFYTDDITDISLNTDFTSMITPGYTTVTSNAGYGAMPDKSIKRASANNRIYIKDLTYTTVSDFVASLGDAELVYELATPTTTPLTQTENDSIASLRTFATTTHFTNNSNTDMTVNYTIKVPTIS